MTTFRLPNIRKNFLPDPGYTVAEIDLSGADAQVVAWDSADENMKRFFREKKKIAAEAAKIIFGGAAGENGRAEPYYSRAKAGGHATNYGATARTVAAAMGVSTHEAEIFQRKWFELFPGIRGWQERVRKNLTSARAVRNMFGYRRFFFDRLDDHTVKEALAWIPQSTVACVTNRAWVSLSEANADSPDGFPVEVLLQVHDSLVFQYPTPREADLLPRIFELVQIPIPYSDPLTISWGLKTSTRSWGEAEEREWIR